MLHTNHVGFEHDHKMSVIFSYCVVGISAAGDLSFEKRKQERRKGKVWNKPDRFRGRMCWRQILRVSQFIDMNNKNSIETSQCCYKTRPILFTTPRRASRIQFSADKKLQSCCKYWLKQETLVREWRCVPCHWNFAALVWTVTNFIYNTPSSLSHSIYSGKCALELC